MFFLFNFINSLFRFTALYVEQAYWYSWCESMESHISGTRDAMVMLTAKAWWRKQHSKQWSSSKWHDLTLHYKIYSAYSPKINRTNMYYNVRWGRGGDDIALNNTEFTQKQCCKKKASQNKWDVSDRRNEWYESMVWISGVRKSFKLRDNMLKMLYLRTAFLSVIILICLVCFFRAKIYLEPASYIIQNSSSKLFIPLSGTFIWTCQSNMLLTAITFHHFSLFHHELTTYLFWKSYLSP